MSKKYASLTTLQTFLENLKNIFASKTEILSTYETKADATSKLTEAKTYTDNAVAQKSQVQIITWEEDD